MKTTLLIKQHQKCLDILKLIAVCESRLYDKISQLKKYKESKHQQWIYPDSGRWIESRIEIDKAIRSRLINYYANTFTKMCQQVQINETV